MSKQEKNSVYLFSLVDDINTACLVFFHGVAMQRRSDGNVIQPVSISIQDGHGMSKVSTDLAARQIVQMEQSLAGE